MLGFIKFHCYLIDLEEQSPLKRSFSRIEESSSITYCEQDLPVMGYDGGLPVMGVGLFILDMSEN